MAMSGGVDSSVAAALLVEQGHEVVGVTMKTFCYSETPDHSKTCCGLDGISDAKRVATALGIPHYVFDVEDAFDHLVKGTFQRFILKREELATRFFHKDEPCIEMAGKSIVDEHSASMTV